MTATTSPPLPVLLVGAGQRMQQHYGPMVRGPLSDRIRPVALVSRSEERARKLAEDLDIPWSLDLEDAAATHGARGAIVGVSAHENHGVAHRVLDLGLPALLETPLALDLREARTLAERCIEQNLPVEVAEQNPRFPREAFWRRIVEEGFLGTPRLVASDRAGYRYHATAVARSLLGRPRGLRAVGMRAVFPIDLGRGESVSTVHSGSVSVESGAVFQLCDGEGIHIAESPWLRGGWGLLCDGGSLGDSAVRIHQGDRAVSLPVERVTKTVDGIEVCQAYRLHGEQLLESPTALPEAALDDDGQAVARCLLDWLDRIEGKPPSSAWSARDAFEDLSWITALERSATLGGASVRVEAL